MKKQCTTCKRTLSIKNFCRNAARPDGYSGQCVECKHACRGRRSRRVCVQCGIEFLAKRPDHRFCTFECALKGKTNPSGPDNGNWRGGQTISSRGYMYIRVLDHPHADKQGYVKRANLVMEKKLGRFLVPGEQVHHRNKIKLDDSPENLEVLTARDHALLHGKERWKPKKYRPPRKVVVYPPIAELRARVFESSLRRVSKELGCSHVAIFNRLRSVS